LMFSAGLMNRSKKSTIPLLIFASGVILNESVLAAQGIGALSFAVLPYANQLLFVIALVMWGSAILLMAAQFRSRDD
jgi:hypothetical protein